MACHGRRRSSALDRSDSFCALMTSDPANASIVAAFDAAAQSYDALTQVQREVARALVARAAGANPEAILDLGAGTGHVTEYALRQWPQAKVTALDAAPAMLAQL